ncbi:MAG: prepilin-type N-terminal cleavage/methylation domain-containing protein [Saccharofermentans sp.]|nr:prepilin-type N-terminal cleavage/methylation domain-containing protein [Clostridiales bacterium]MCR5049006.1 prepilin-type N-terminal cleavage/methylation domain-containing protein [Saccharofermentans sp.]
MEKINKRDKKGFTLIEMMIVVAILVILASITFLNAADAIQRSKNNATAEESRFVTQVQSQADYIRHSMLSGSPRFSA